MTDHPSALVSVPEPMIEAFRDWYALHFGRPIMKGKARKIVGRILSAAPAAPQASGVGEIAKACAVFQEAIDYFEADVADVMAEGSERADLWDREVTVNIDALKAVMNAALATREEAPAEAGSFEERAIMLVRKHGDPNGSDYEQGQNDMGHRMVTMAREADALLRAQPQARSGKVTWHSSGEDEGPDVGLQLDIGGGCSLWLGEGKKPTGWQIAIVHDDEIVPVADVIDHEQARELFDRIASAVQPQAREDAQPVISAGRVLADALRQYGFPVSGGAKAALWDHGSAEALALNEACVAFLAALQAEQGAK